MKRKYHISNMDTVIIIICTILFSTIFIINRLNLDDTTVAYTGSILGSITTITAIRIALLANKESKIKDTIIAEIYFPVKKILNSYSIKSNSRKDIVSFNIDISKLKQIRENNYYDSKHNIFKDDIDEIIEKYNEITNISIHYKIGEILVDNFIKSVEEITNDKNILKIDNKINEDTIIKENHPALTDSTRIMYESKFQNTVLDLIENSDFFKYDAYPLSVNYYLDNDLTRKYRDILNELNITKGKFRKTEKFPTVDMYGEIDSESVELFLEYQIFLLHDLGKIIEENKYFKNQKKEIENIKNKINSLLKKVKNEILE